MDYRAIFRAFLSLVVLGLGSAFLWEAAFVVEYADPSYRLRIIDGILVLVIGVISTVIAFHLGSSQGSKDKVSSTPPVPPVKDTEGENHV